MVTSAVPVGANIARPMTREEKKVIFASSLGTVFEWYDFYLYGSLAAIVAKHFFSGLDPTAAFIAALMAFAAGFLVRPFGALVFGRLGDMIGRKYTFLVTILIMGLSTFIVGLLPTLRLDRHRRADHPRRPAPAPGPGPRRRVRRCRDLRRRARAARQARRVHVVDPDDGDARPLPLADRHHRLQGDPRRRGVRRLGLARSVPAVVPPADHLGLDPAQPERDAGLQEDEGRGQDLEGAAVGVVRPVEERQDRPARAARPHRRPGRRLVHGPVLRALLPDRAAEGRRRRRRS